MAMDGKNILVLGAGKIGGTVIDMLIEYYDVWVTSADISIPDGGIKDSPINYIAIDVNDDDALLALISEHDLVINALPFFLATKVATAAAKANVSYMDLTEDVKATENIRALAQGSNAVFMPQCGLAPGVIGMLGGELAECFEELFDLKLRVGALTRNATNSLRYNFTWSVDGVVNEYCNPCEAIVSGQHVKLQPLEGYETLILDAEQYEAFNTSGGLGTLSETLKGRVRNLDYKTIRYPGHRDAMRFLLNDLRLIERRDLLREVLELAVPHSREDLVILFASASGMREGRFEQVTRLIKVHGLTLRNRERTAIEITTAAGVIGAAEILLSGKIKKTGFVGQEDVRLDDFRVSRVGHFYAGL